MANCTYTFRPHKVCVTLRSAQGEFEASRQREFGFRNGLEPEGGANARAQRAQFENDLPILLDL